MQSRKGNVIRWIKPDEIKKNLEIFRNYKIFISKSAGNPNKDAKVIGMPYVGEPYSSCTDSLITIGNFDTLEEANNLQKYIKTQFFRFMVSILKSSQSPPENQNKAFLRFPVGSFYYQKGEKWLFYAKKRITEIVSFQLSLFGRGRRT